MGNLTIGVVTDNHLKELFNGALSHLVPDPHNNPPVVSAQLDPSGNDPHDTAKTMYHHGPSCCQATQKILRIPQFCSSSEDIDKSCLPSCRKIQIAFTACKQAKNPDSLKALM